MICVPVYRLLFAFVIVFLFSAGSAYNVAAQTRKIATSSIPLIFEQNKGQVPAQYQFVSRRNGMETLYDVDGMEIFVPESPSSRTRLQIHWVGTNGKATLAGEDALPGHSSYLRGSDEAKWLRGIPQFGRVRYEQLYPGIDLLFHGNEDALENDYVVEAAADPSQIRFRFDRGVRINSSGDLDVVLDESTIQLQKPIAYQEIGNDRQQVAVKFVVLRDGVVSFRVGAYDHNRALVIDPVFGFSTYLAGSGNDQITAVTTDASGNVYVTGYTNSVDFPLAKPEQPTCASCTDFIQDPDAYVSKFDPTGHTLLYSTYIGGSAGDYGYSIALDKKDDILVAGVSLSADFPHAGAVQSPACQTNNQCFFVLSLKPDGSAFNYSGLIGGAEGMFTNGNNGILAVDASGNAYLNGETDDPNFQLTPGTLGPTLTGYPFNSTFVMKVDPTGKLIYSTTIPGNAPENPGTAYTDDFPAGGILVDANGQVTLSGVAGLGLPTTPGVLQGTFPNDGSSPNAQAGYLLQLNGTATALNFATYLRGTDSANGLAVDASGDFYIAGNTSEPNLPVSANAYQKTIIPGPECTCNAGYVLKLDSQGRTALAATYLAGTPSQGNEGTTFFGIALDSKSNIFLGGMTGSTDFPLQNPFVSVLQFSFTDAGLVLAKMNPNLSTLLFGSYLSSTAPQGGSLFAGLTIDAQDNAIVIGNTYATDFPTTANSFQPVPPSSPNPLSTFPQGFISKLNLATPAPSVCLNTPGINFGAVLVNTSASQPLTVTNCGNAPLQLGSIISSLPVVTVTQSCGPIAPAASCAVQLTFSPVDASTSTGTLTLTDNAAIPIQTVSFLGTGGAPQIFFPPGFNVSDLLVGTQQEFDIIFINQGNGNWIVSNVTATGDFSVNDQCTAPLPPTNPSNPGTPFCYIGVIFAPTQAGVRNGVLTITDNAPGSPHVIQLSGNGLTMYPAPSITSILAVPSDEINPQLQITGTNFFPASQVIVNGSIRTTIYLDEDDLVANLNAGDLTQAAELPVTVSNPLPGGGSSNTSVATIYTAIRNIGILNSVYDTNSGLLYASVSTSSAKYPNQVIAFDPSTASVVHAWSVGNGPNQLAISGDGKFLYVGLNGDMKVAQVSVPSGVVNFAVGLGIDPLFNDPMIADAIRVLPGQPHSWAVTLCATAFFPCGVGIAVFDDAVERPTLVAVSQLQPDVLLFIGTNGETLFGTTLNQGPSTFYEFSINSAGITETTSVTNFSSASPGGGYLDTDGRSIYVSNGQVIDPNTLAITSTIQGVPFGGGIKVDVPNSRVYFAGGTTGLSSNFTVEAFNLASQNLDSTIPMSDFLASPTGMFRWGTNGLVLTSPNALLVFRTSLTGTSAVPSQLAVYGWAPSTVAAGTPDLTLTINGAQFAAGDTLTANGTSLPLTVLSASQITTTIPASFLATAGNVAIAIKNPANQVASFVLVVTAPGSPAAALSTGSLTFATQFVNTSSAPQSVTVSNSGDGTLVVSSITITGDFSQTNNCSSVAPASSCSISVVFAPTTAGARTGSLTINDNDASKMQTVTLSGSATDIQIGGGGAGTTATVPSGQSAIYNLTLTPEGGFTGQLTFSCTNLPADATCSISPSSAMFASSAVNVTVTLSTSAQQATLPNHNPEIKFGTISWLAALLLLLFAVRSGSTRRARKLKFAVVVLAAVLASLPLMSCGGGSGMGSGTTPPASISTPPGTYTVNFVAAGNGISRSIPLTLVVQ
jgi:Abnormal spindle-like microcephaly-assoc'd, ASPM-SPD-2-Hydin/Beta-propeller repeat